MKEAIMLSLEQELLDLRVKVLRSQMDPHFIFNALGAIQYFIIKNDKLRALKYLTVFSKLLRKYLNNLDAESIPVCEEVTNLKWYLQLQQLRYGNKLTYTFKVDDTVKKYTIPTLILQLCIEDIVERSILENVENRNLSINFSRSNSMLLASIKMVSKKTGANRNFKETYRNNKFTWVNQIDQLNSLKNLRIEKAIHITNNASNISTEFELLIPLT